MGRLSVLTLSVLLLFSATCFALDPPAVLRIVNGEEIPPTSPPIEGPTPDWNFDVPRGASRTTGVAPLAVHFSAGLTASSPGNMPFHDYEYAWNFGDPNSGVWGTSGKSKNTDKGPVAAHVYETPGTYTATLTVRNSSGVVDTETFTIAVQDPNTVFAGTRTTCISTTSDFTGCPTGAERVTTTNLAVISSYTSAGSRVLLRRGSSWTVSSGPSFPNSQGPVHIGAFGSCSSPDALGICSNAPSVTMTGNHVFINLTDKSDWRLSDVAFSASKSLENAAFTGGVINIKNNLLLRINAKGGGQGYGWSHWRDYDFDYHDNNAIVSSRSAGTAWEGAYVGSERLTFMGNIIQDSDGTHVLRVWQGFQAVVSHNVLAGASIARTSGRLALKFHGPAPIGSSGDRAKVGTVAQTGKGGLRNYSQFAVIANNVFGASGPWPVVIGPQDTQNAEAISDVLFDKNRVINDYGTRSGNNADQTMGVRLSGRYFSVRNNIMIGSGATIGYTGISLLREGVEWMPLGHRVYNNTIYHNGELSGNPVGVSISSAVSDSIVRNNYVSFPNATGSGSAISNGSNSTTASSNIHTKTSNFVDPNNSNPLVRNFRLTSAATPAIKQGFAVPVFDDFAGTSRTSPFDLGAFCFE